MRLSKVRSPQLRGAQHLGKEHRDRHRDGWTSTALNGPPPACAPSQYDRDDDVPVLVSQ
jgi:hypothetical protein